MRCSTCADACRGLTAHLRLLLLLPLALAGGCTKQIFVAHSLTLSCK